MVINAECNIIVEGEDTVYVYFRCIVYDREGIHVFVDNMDTPKELVDKMNDWESLMCDDSVYIRDL